jgi:hypothetical protein
MMLRVNPRDYYFELLRSVFADKRWVVTSDVLAGCTKYVAALKALGAERALCIATSEGAGAGPDPEFAPNPIVSPVEAPDVMSGIRLSLDAFANLPPQAVAQVDAFDPAGTARVLGTIFDDGRDVAGRKKYGARTAAWQALEDKTSVDAFWEAAGIPHAPSAIVPARLDALGAASARLDAGHGCAWAGDNREGFNGGAVCLRWVQTADEQAAAAEFFAAHCDQVRVMPFLEGIPCSIHGFVLPDYVVALRPCELFVLRRPEARMLSYARAGSFWDPSAGDRASMQDVARRAGAHLQQSVGFRGAFTVDGVLTKDGFLPTELNPRFGAALFLMTAGLELPLLLLNAVIIEEHGLDFRPAELEALLLAHADTHRAGGGLAISPKRGLENQEAKLVWRDGVFVVVDDSTEDADAIVRLGPASAGSAAIVDLIAERTPVGPSAAPRIAAALACVDAHWDLGIGPLQPAPDVRRSSADDTALASATESS